MNTYLNTLKVFSLRDIVRLYLIENPDKYHNPNYANKLNKSGLIQFIKKRKIKIDDYNYNKTPPKRKIINTNILKKYNLTVYDKEKQEEFLNEENKNKQFALNPRKNKNDTLDLEDLTIEDQTARKNKENLQLQKHQLEFIKQFIYSNLQGAIMFHGVGSGKTLTAVVCAYWYLQLYPSNRVICISPSALLYNFIEGMKQYGVDIQDNRYFFTTYDKYVRMSRENKNASNCLLIVDEAHNLRTEMKIDYVTDPNKPDEVLYREARVNKRGFNILEYGAKNAHKTLLLTGTAFVNTIYDIENLIAMVDKREPLLKTTFSYMVSSTSNISDYFSYKISYVPSSKSDFFPERREKLIPLYMTEKMQQEYNSFKNAKRNYFYIREKLKMNVVENEDTEMNPKIKWCIDEIINKPKQKFIIYTGMFDTGIELIQDELKKNKIEFVRITGRETATKKEESKQIYNSYNFKNNEGCRVLLISKAGAEGVDTKNTQNIILLDHQWNDATSEQIIARAIRFKSHFDLPKSEQYVNVYRLFLLFKHDEELFKKIESKDIDFIQLNNEIRDAVREEAKILKKDKNRIQPTEELLKTLKEGDTDVLFIPNKDATQMVKGGYNKKKDVEIVTREGWESYNELDKLEKEKWIIKLYAEWYSLYKRKRVNMTHEPAVDLRLYILCQAKLANIIEFISYFGNIIKLFETYEYKLLELIIEKKKELGRDITDIEENKIYEECLKDEKIKLVNKLYVNKTRTQQEKLQQYFTNPEVADALIKNSGIANNKNKSIHVLEPTAGDGSLIGPLMKLLDVNIKVDAIELDQKNRDVLSKLDNPHNVLRLLKHRNFLTYFSGAIYDYIFSNPPFHLRKGENPLMIKDVYDFDFILRAYAMLKPGGQIHAIISGKWLNYKSDNKNLNYIKEFTKFENIGDNIKYSGVQVKNTYFISIIKPIPITEKEILLTKDIDNEILQIKYYNELDNSLIGESIINGETHLDDIKEPETEKIKYKEAPKQNITNDSIIDPFFMQEGDPLNNFLNKYDANYADKSIIEEAKKLNLERVFIDWGEYRWLTKRNSIYKKKRGIY